MELVPINILIPCESLCEFSMLLCGTCRSHCMLITDSETEDAYLQGGLCSRENEVSPWNRKARKSLQRQVFCSNYIKRGTAVSGCLNRHLNVCYYLYTIVSIPAETKIHRRWYRRSSARAQWESGSLRSALLLPGVQDVGRKFMEQAFEASIPTAAQALILPRVFFIFSHCFLKCFFYYI